jgi:predicted enzyme related to lactoylglutathione lyase
MSRPIHFEILAQDPASATEFYRQAFGWEINAWDMPGSTYWLVATGRGPRGIDGAIMPPGQLAQVVINTIEVASMDEARAKIEAAGGRLVQGPSDIPNVGVHAYFADLEGTLFGVLQPPPGNQPMQQDDPTAAPRRHRRSASARKRTSSPKAAVRKASGKATARKAPARKAVAKGGARKSAVRAKKPARGAIRAKAAGRARTKPAPLSAGKRGGARRGGRSGK